jgi:hypothetical protein
MRLVVNLYRQCKPAERRSLPAGDLSQYPVDEELEKKRLEKEEARKKAKAEKEEAKERQRREEEAARQRREREKQAAKNRGKKRPPFDFAKVRLISCLQVIEGQLLRVHRKNPKFLSPSQMLHRPRAILSMPLP